MVYLKIGTTQFIGELAPSSVSPSVEIVKNEERSLDGTMNVDVIARKIKLTVGWDVLGSSEMQTVCALESAERILTVQYIDANTSALKEIKAYVDGIEYTPFFEDDIIRWKDVSLSLVEI